VLAEDSSAILPAWQMFIEGMYSAVGAILLLPGGRKLSRRTFCASALASSSVLLLRVGWSAVPPAMLARWLDVVMLQISALGLRIVFKCISLLTNQIATEIYPTVAAATGTGVVIGVSRVGSIVAPTVCEWVYALSGVNVAIYFVSAVLALAASVGILTCMSSHLEDMVRAAAGLIGELAPLKVKGSAPPPTVRARRSSWTRTRPSPSPR